MTTPRSRRTFGKLLAGLALASTAIAFTSHSPISVSAAAGDGLIDINTNQGQCNSAGSIDAYESAWNWTKPTLEYSTDNGATWNSAGGSYPYGMTVCRDIRENQQPGRLYWFIIQKKDGNDDMGANGLVPLFRATIPLKAGDATTRLTGYSEVKSFVEENGAAVVVTKASGLAKVNMGSGENDFKTRHPECASKSWQEIQGGRCDIDRADRDITAMVIQHIEFSESPLTSWQQLYKGLWIGANVNGYNAELSCGSLGGDSSGNSGNSGGFNDGGQNKDGGGSQTTKAPSLEVSVSGTPHLTAAGGINEGDMQVFIPAATALSCFGDGLETTTLSTIATALAVVRSEATQGTSTPTYTSTAVTAPVAGILVQVDKMTFSSPTYKVTSSLTAKLSHSVTTKGKKATLKLTFAKATKIKIFALNSKGKSKMVKALKAKKGTTSVTLAYAKGMKYLIKDAKGKTTLKTITP